MFLEWYLCFLRTRRLNNSFLILSDHKQTDKNCILAMHCQVLLVPKRRDKINVLYHLPNQQKPCSGLRIHRLKQDQDGGIRSLQLAKYIRCATSNCNRRKRVSKHHQPTDKSVGINSWRNLLGSRYLSGHLPFWWCTLSFILSLSRWMVVHARPP